MTSTKHTAFNLLYSPLVIKAGKGDIKRFSRTTPIGTRLPVKSYFHFDITVLVQIIGMKNVIYMALFYNVQYNLI